MIALTVIEINGGVWKYHKVPNNANFDFARLSVAMVTGLLVWLQEFLREQYVYVYDFF